MNRDYYVYALFRENETPFYIGMGKGRRISSHEAEARKRNTYKNNIINKLLSEGRQILKIKLIDNLTREEAFEIECILIQLIGRYPEGPLANLTSGGDGSRDMSADARARIGVASKGNKRALGNVKTLEGRLRIAEAARNRVHSLETRAKRAAHGVGRKWSVKSRLKASVARKKWHSQHPERGVALAEANRSRTPEMKAATAAKRIGRKHPWTPDPYLFWYSSHVEQSPTLSEAVGLR